MSALGSGQQSLQHHRNTLVLNGNDTHFAALAFYGEGVFSKCPFHCRCVYAKALVNTKPCIAPKVEGENEVVTIFRHRLAEQTVELRPAPCPVKLSEPAALQLDA